MHCFEKKQVLTEFVIKRSGLRGEALERKKRIIVYRCFKITPKNIQMPLGSN